MFERNMTRTEAVQQMEAHGHEMGPWLPRPGTSSRFSICMRPGCEAVMYAANESDRLMNPYTPFPCAGEDAMLDAQAQQTDVAAREADRVAREERQSHDD